jgi:DNA-binding beta-propeller fold protein YncE
VFSRDGSFALVTRDNDHKISVLSISGDKVEYTKRDINAGLRLYQVDIGGAGDVALVANIGIGQGDADTISVIDLKAKPARVVNTVSVGQTPEGLKVSPDGQHVAVTIMNGSNKPKNSPFFNDNGLVKIYRVSGHDLTQVAEAPVGHWCQGAAWSKDGKTLLVQCMVEKEILSFSFDGSKALQKTGSIKVSGGPAGIRTAEP